MMMGCVYVLHGWMKEADKNRRIRGQIVVFSILRMEEGGWPQAFIGELFILLCHVDSCQSHVYVCLFVQEKTPFVMLLLSLPHIRRRDDDRLLLSPWSSSVVNCSFVCSVLCVSVWLAKIHNQCCLSSAVELSLVESFFSSPRSFTTYIPNLR